MKAFYLLFLSIMTVGCSTVRSGYVAVEGGGHMLNMERPHDFNRHVLQFLRQHPQ